MALVKSTLKTSLINVFNTMEDDSDFCEGIANAIKSYAEAGSVVTVDSGTVSGGAFVGSGNGHISLNASDMYTPMKSKCAQMKENYAQSGYNGDNELADAFGSSLDTMTGKSNIVSTNVSGTVTTPSGASSALSGTAKGTISCNSTSLVSGLKQVFYDMKTNHSSSYDDTYLAGKIADFVDAYFKAGSISTNGQGALSGSAGTGTIS